LMMLINRLFFSKIDINKFLLIVLIYDFRNEFFGR